MRSSHRGQRYIATVSPCSDLFLHSLLYTPVFTKSAFIFIELAGEIPSVHIDPLGWFRGRHQQRHMRILVSSQQKSAGLFEHVIKDLCLNKRLQIEQIAAFIVSRAALKIANSALECIL